jgi:hypothetical protein
MSSHGSGIALPVEHPNGQQTWPGTPGHPTELIFQAFVRGAGAIPMSESAVNSL